MPAQCLLLYLALLAHSLVVVCFGGFLTLFLIVQDIRLREREWDSKKIHLLYKIVIYIYFFYDSIIIIIIINS